MEKELLIQMTDVETRSRSLHMWIQACRWYIFGTEGRDGKKPSILLNTSKQHPCSVQYACGAYNKSNQQLDIKFQISLLFQIIRMFLCMTFKTCIFKVKLLEFWYLKLQELGLLRPVTMYVFKTLIICIYLYKYVTYL